jgi:hypothetical protein
MTGEKIKGLLNAELKDLDSWLAKNAKECLSFVAAGHCSRCLR